MAGEQQKNSRYGSDNAAGANPIAIIKHERDEQRYLCRELEHIADRLPRIDRKSLDFVYDGLKRRLPIYHRNEEALFFLLANRSPAQFNVERIVEWVRYEHQNHNSYASEYFEFFQAANEQTDLSVFGYMFRSFFETIYRHIEWEELALMPLISSYLTQPDLKALSATVEKNRREIGPVVSLSVSSTPNQ